MKVAIRLFLFAGFVAAVLALDAGTQSNILVSPGGFEAAMVLPAAFYMLGAIATLIASVLSVIRVRRQKEKLKEFGAAWACAILIAGYVGLLFVHP